MPNVGSLHRPGAWTLECSNDDVFFLARRGTAEARPIACYGLAQRQPSALHVFAQRDAEHSRAGVVEDEVDGEVGVVEEHEIALQHVRQTVVLRVREL